MNLRSIHLHEIPDDGLEFDVELDRSWLVEAFAGTGYAPVGDARPGTAHVRLEKHGREVTLTGNASARITGACVRCLEKVTVPVDAHFVLYLEPKPGGQHAHDAEVELSADQLDADYYDGDVIEIAPWVREQLVLEAPNHPTCPAGCAEPIQPPMADVRNRRTVDPRLAPLMKFAKKME